MGLQVATAHQHLVITIDFHEHHAGLLHDVIGDFLQCRDIGAEHRVLHGDRQQFSGGVGAAGNLFFVGGPKIVDAGVQQDHQQQPFDQGNAENGLQAK